MRAVLDQSTLSNEQRLLLLSSRIQLNEQEEESIRALLKDGIDMPKLIGLASRHKVLQLMTPHLIRLDDEKNMTTTYKFLLHYHYIGNRQKNVERFKEFNRLLQTFRNAKLKAVPLKGAILTPLVYKDYGLRMMSDLDFLIHPDDRKNASSLLKKEGFIIGKYDWAADQEIPIEREEEMMWRINAGNLYSHIKRSGEDFLKVHRVDFSYDVELKKNYEATNALLDAAEEKPFFQTDVYLLQPLDFLIHLAFHLYKEATNVQYVYLHADLNLIKFCDVREYVMFAEEQYQLDWPALQERAKELGAEKALFYTFTFLDLLYQTNYIDELKQLDMSDQSFLEAYGENDFGSSKIWKKSFIERFFSLDNRDELEEEPAIQLFPERQ
ncbi:nucleotidyltransferase family protein [Bacillus safensis]|uniref:nucleotidyltransferase domain-containing protein n=1 Tax=Bacillus safensis TaxID=561879 RepID=UPI002237644E|nr:nucleotidyltransferase family protein [Bacillus safensis]MCW4643896.1 nucleotidyltransferase family protein [Bacillus safensis]MCY7562941.1 nucleotidyltransferase family protein [Bacillus safensis]MCY7624414.1 nucleotidyltransferase family protein [Bacillus safensis]MCY7631843.1 nucleotidyltransferase family protein [Bacillus safensis]MCY7647347.1 nucleotidyltransferase family protein [Bacillus safensis]